MNSERTFYVNLDFHQKTDHIFHTKNEFRVAGNIKVRNQNNRRKYTHNHLQVNDVINNQKHCKKHVIELIFYAFMRIKSGRGGESQRQVIIK